MVVRFPDLDIALRIERRWPGLNDRLASTVQFLRSRPDDDRLGSPSLREATVRQTLEETRSIDFREVIDAAVGPGAGMASGSLDLRPPSSWRLPELSTIALRRLFLPSATLAAADASEPARRETPRKVARGEPFAWASPSGGETVSGTARPPTASPMARSSPRPSGRRGGLPRPDGVGQRIQLLGRRGRRFDLDPQRRRQGRAASRLDQVLTIRLIPPAYTGLPDQRCARAYPVRAVKGTPIEIRRRPTSRSRPPLSIWASRRSAAVAFDKARTRLSTNFVVATSLPFWFDFHDTDGFANREAPRYDVRSIRDDAPRVVIDQPPNDRDVPAKAVVPVRFTVDDDYGIQSARILYKTASGGSEPSGEVALPLWDSLI